MWSGMLLCRTGAPPASIIFVANSRVLQTTLPLRLLHKQSLRGYSSYVLNSGKSPIWALRPSTARPAVIASFSTSASPYKGRRGQYFSRKWSYYIVPRFVRRWIASYPQHHITAIGVIALLLVLGFSFGKHIYVYCRYGNEAMLSGIPTHDEAMGMISSGRGVTLFGRKVDVFLDSNLRHESFLANQAASRVKYPSEMTEEERAEWVEKYGEKVGVS